MRAVRLQTEYMTQPLGLGNSAPRFSWNCEGGLRQTAYQLVCRRGSELIWDSGKVESARMTQISYTGKTLNSRDIVDWSVTLWDEQGEAGEPAESRFEMGLLRPEDWEAQWISGDYKPKAGRRYPTDLFRRRFAAGEQPVQARIYATARGVYDLTLNGTRIEDFILAPGSTDYRKRIQAQVYDVTALIRSGSEAGEADNTLEIRLADGWFRGSSAAYGVTNVYGTQTSVMAQLELTYADGSRKVIGTDGGWDWSDDGPIRFADLKDGEIYDAQKAPAYGGRAQVVKAPEAVIAPSDNVPVREHERFAAKLLMARDGTRVLDFGQNIAGYPEFSIRGRKGEKLRFVCGEVLDENGRVDLSGIQETRPAKGWTQLSLLRKLMTTTVSGPVDPTPHQEILFTCSGGEDHYKTSFAFFGFRYMEIRGELAVDPADFTAVAVYSDLEETGTFACSDARINRLFENTRWSMKGNFLDVPTDCPTRERLGWTGDAQVFFETGAYLMNTAPFFAKWLKDMEDSQYKNGLIPAVLPYAGVEQMYKATGSSVGWADAIYLIPYRYWKRFGDAGVLSRYWPMMEKYADYLLGHLGLTDRKKAAANPENAYTYEKGVHLGEWLEPEEFRDPIYGARAKHPEECTAYLYLAMTTLAEIARELGKDAEAARYEGVAAGARHAYLRFAELDTDRQAKLVRPLALGLLEGELREKTLARLAQAAENYRYRVATGFLSTPFLLPMLTEAGGPELAYKVLLNEERPGWLSEVLAGATTIWEDWEGKLSQNHYSPGAVCQWLFEGSAGIRVSGERSFAIRPLPGGGLDYAEASYLSPYGLIKSRWEKAGDGYAYTVSVPANCRAQITLPDGRTQSVEAGTYVF